MSDPLAEPKQRRGSFWREVVTNPVTLGAIITAYVALNTAIFNYLGTKNAQEMERAKFEFEASLEERKYKTGLLLEVVKAAGSDQQIAVRRLCALAATGLVPQFAERVRQHAAQTCSPDTLSRP